MTTKGKISPEELERFYESSKLAGVKPGWLGRGSQATPKTQPFLWRWSEIRPLVHLSGEVVTPDRDVERRTMRLSNPGLDYGTTHTIPAALQLLLRPPPHPHRHPVGVGRGRGLHHG